MVVFVVHAGDESLVGGRIENQFSQVPIASVPHTQAIVVLGGTVLPPSGK